MADLPSRSLERPTDGIDAELRYFRENFDTLLVDLARSLNGVLPACKSAAFWRVLAGPWLHTFTAFTLMQLKAGQPAAAAPPTRYVPAAYGDFARASHLESYVRLVVADASQAEVLPSEPAPEPSAPDWRQRLRILVKAAHWRVQGILCPGADVVIRAGYFPRSAAVKLWWRGRGRVRFDWREHGWQADDLPVDQTRRAALAEGLLRPGMAGIDAVLRRLIPLHLPRTYLEGFERLAAAAARAYRKPAAAYFTCNALWHDEVFKFHAAEARDAGSRLLIGQHGGNHGIWETLLDEAFERGTADRYCTWGWREDQRTVALPAPKLMEVRPRERIGLQPEILFTATAAVAVDNSINSLTTKPPNDEYLAWQMRFIAALPPALRPRLRFRFLRDWIGGFWAPLKARFPEVMAESSYDGASFPSRLAACRLFVSDHLSTTYAEALASDTPTILFWDPAFVAIRPAARPFFDALHRCGILHYTPESAAAEAAAAFADPESWWADPARRQAVEHFRRNYLLMADKAVDLWVNFLLDEARSHAYPPQA